ncbi:MAG TPA: AraC family transcriptional regulator [Bacteroidales bacterium]|jgi:AraC-like DNA-binding protein|nr:AraC family transcriptional regulator [Bacteroidales bacterium]HQH23325.1 AraC family transcriptional regulator [Bacteroidales bacterium]HQJ83092.1 AraC family transcriptional regulator [Bacteroidales bacterium]
MVNIDPILYIGISQSFFAGLLISTKKPFTTANRILAAWVFLICIELIFALINSTVIEMYSFPFVSFTYGPLLFLYIYFMVNPGKKFNWLSLLHFIPFITFFIVSVIFRSKPLLRDLRSFFVPDRFITLRIVYSTAMFTSLTVYSTLAFIMIRKHQKNLKNLVSYTSNVMTLNWLKVISISLYVSFLILFILGGLNMIGDIIPFDPYFVVFGFISVFSFVYSFYGIKQPVIFDPEIETNGDEKKETEKYIKSGLKDEQAQEYLEKLISVMETDKPFLNRDLSIQDLALITDIPRHHITQVLNEVHGKNFFTFINEYRVEEVINRFRDPANNNFTILAIAFDAGFNSKATFNSIFKLQTGMTPSEYREKLTGIRG